MNEGVGASRVPRGAVVAEMGAGRGRGGHDEARSADQNHVQECAKVHAAEPGAAEGLRGAGRGREKGVDA